MTITAAFQEPVAELQLSGTSGWPKIPEPISVAVRMQGEIMMRFAVTAIAAALAIMITPRLDPTLAAEACSCAGTRPPCEAFAAASSVFIGTVDQISTILVERGEGRQNEKYDQRLVRFTVQQGFKGVGTETVEVETGMGGGDCGYPFKMAEVYLVYAYRHPERHALVTGICSRTRPLAGATEDLSYIRTKPNADLGNRLFGKVLYQARDPKLRRPIPAQPMPGIRVVVEGPGFRSELITDKEGRYEATRLRPGKYRARAVLPEDLGANDPYDVDVAEGGCAELDVYVRLDGHITGRIFGEEGKPVSGIKIDLVLADPSLENPRQRLISIGQSDKEGKYEIKWIDPGDYYLGINLSWAPEIDHPYRRTYYPGFNNMAQAKVITVGRGSKLGGYDFVLPQRMAERVIHGTVAWGDGRPASDVTVTYAPFGYEGESLPFVAELDTKGNYSMKVLEGLHYWVMAGAMSPEGKRFHADPVEFLPENLKDPISLTIKEPGAGMEHYRTLMGSKSP